MAESSFQILKGSLLVYRVFDVAEEVDLGRVEALLSEPTARLRLTRSPRKPVVLRNAPVTVALGEQEIELSGKIVRTELQAKVWDYGVLSLMFTIPLAGCSREELQILADAVDECTHLDEIARKRAEELSRDLKQALKDPHSWESYEDYVIFFLEKLEGVSKAIDLIEEIRIPELLLAEGKEPLAPKTRELILEAALQYSDQDLVIIDWNSALVVEPSGLRDIPDVLEFAVTQLMEMRYYDELLDRRLGSLYDNIEKQKDRLLRNTFARLSREASMRYVEFSEFIERVDNSLKVVGDFYLATVFRHAARKLRIENWQQSITRKMGVLAQVSEILQGEVNTTRSLWLEAIVVGLIFFEILTAFVK